MCSNAKCCSRESYLDYIISRHEIMKWLSSSPAKVRVGKCVCRVGVLFHSLLYTSLRVFGFRYFGFSFTQEKMIVHKDLSSSAWPLCLKSYSSNTPSVRKSTKNVLLFHLKLFPDLYNFSSFKPTFVTKWYESLYEFL